MVTCYLNTGYGNTKAEFLCQLLSNEIFKVIIFQFLIDFSIFKNNSDVKTNAQITSDKRKTTVSMNQIANQSVKKSHRTVPVNRSLTPSESENNSDSKSEEEESETMNKKQSSKQNKKPLKQKKIKQSLKHQLLFLIHLLMIHRNQLLLLMLQYL